MTVIKSKTTIRALSTRELFLPINPRFLQTNGKPFKRLVIHFATRLHGIVINFAATINNKRRQNNDT